MSKINTVSKGTFIVIDFNIYGEGDVQGLCRARKALNMEKLLTEYKKDKDFREGFDDWLIKKGYVERIECVKLNVGGGYTPYIVTIEDDY